MGPPGRLLAIDYGRVRIGVAVCDELGIAAHGFGHVARANDDAAAEVIARLAAQEHVAGIIVGLPLHSGGEAGRSVGWVRDFIRVLRRHTSLPIHEVDERLSSAEAEAALRAAERWPPSHPGEVDAQAAAIVLRRYLDGER